MTEIDTVCVGTSFRGAVALDAVSQMTPGAEVTLVRDAANQYDANAVQCHFRGAFIGFVPKQANPRVAAAMDAGAIPVAICQAPAVVRAGRVAVEPKLRIAWRDAPRGSNGPKI